MTYFRMFCNLKQEILANSMNDGLFRDVMNVRFSVTLAVLGLLYVKRFKKKPFLYGAVTVHRHSFYRVKAKA